MPSTLCSSSVTVPNRTTNTKSACKNHCVGSARPSTSKSVSSAIGLFKQHSQLLWVDRSFRIILGARARDMSFCKQQTEDQGPVHASTPATCKAGQQWLAEYGAQLAVGHARDGHNRHCKLGRREVLTGCAGYSVASVRVASTNVVKIGFGQTLRSPLAWNVQVASGSSIKTG